MSITPRPLFTPIPSNATHSESLGDDVGQILDMYKGFIACAFIIVMYNLVMFGPWKSSKMFSTIQRNKRSGRNKMLHRWPRVMLGTKAPVLAIQSLRCALQGSIFFATTALGLATFCILMDESRPLRRFTYVLIATVLLCAVVCFSQHMRLVLHLNYFVMAQPKTERREQQRPSALPHGSGQALSNFGHEAIQHISGATTLDTPEAFAAAPAHLQQMQLEEDMNLEDDAERISYILRRAMANFSMGMRCMMYAIPLILGLIDSEGYVMMGASVLLVFVMFYYDRALSIDGNWD